MNPASVHARGGVPCSFFDPILYGKGEMLVMQNRHTRVVPPHSPPSRVSRWLGLVCLLAAIALAGGCGNKAGTGSSVSGKVTLEGQPVAGSVVFVYGAEEKANAPIGVNGAYSIPNPPKGQVKVLVRAIPGSTGVSPVGPIPKGSGPEMPSMGGTSSAGVPPPAKYASPETSGLTYEVKGGTKPLTFRSRSNPVRGD